MTVELHTIDLRPGGVNDIALVEQLMVDAFDPRYGEAWTRAQCLGVLGMPGVWLILAEINGVAAGFALARAVADEAELLLLATARTHRRRGIGGALLAAVIDGCRARELKLLHLEVRAGNDAARLYRGGGFTKVGERRGYYRGRDGGVYDAHTFRRLVG